MLTLFSYPDLYGVADNNPYGLKVYAFLKLCKLAFRHEHIRHKGPGRRTGIASGMNSKAAPQKPPGC